MNLPAYPRYRRSGVEWLGNVPAHWEVKRLKYLASANDDVLDENTSPDWELLYVDIGGVDSVLGITVKEPMVFEDAPSRARRLVNDGDTIVSTVRTYLKAVAPIRSPEPNLVVSTGFAVIRPRKLDADFLSFFLRSHFFIEAVVARSVGVSYPAIKASELVKIPAPLPEPDEQRQIGSILTAEMRKLDAFITTVGTTTPRLEEYRTALITAAVTGKIDVRAVDR